MAATLSPPITWNTSKRLLRTLTGWIKPQYVLEGRTVVAPPKREGAIYLDGVVGVVIIKCTVSGGGTNIYLHRCKYVYVVDCTCMNAHGPADPLGCGIMLNGCSVFNVSDNKIIRSLRSEDGLNPYGSNNGLFARNVVSVNLRPKSWSGNPGTVDYRANNIAWDSNVFDAGGNPRCGVVAAGTGSLMHNTTCMNCWDAALAVQQCYDDDPPRDVTIRGTVFKNIKGRRLWVDPRCRNEVVHDVA